MRGLIVAYLRNLVPHIPAGVHLTSWFRDAAHNRSVGGHRESQHLYGLATDWSGDPVALRQMQLFVTEHDLVAIQEGDHLHIQAYPHGVLASAGFTFPPRV